MFYKTNTYKTYRNLYNRIKRTAKELYYVNLMESYKNDIKKTWQVLKPIIGKQNDRTSLASTFMIDSNAVSNPQDIANEFCKFFTTVGRKTQQSIQRANSLAKDHLLNHVNNSIFHTNLSRRNN